jgi:hypothetical protein
MSNLKIILKADDFSPVTFMSIFKGLIKFRIHSLGIPHSVSLGWKKYIAFTSERKICTDFGIIGNTLRFISENSSFVHITRKLLNENNGIWNHGYFHKMDEFKGRHLDYQINNIKRTNTILKKLFDINDIAFGAPGNNIDENTNKALVKSGNPVWFFGNKENSRYLLLDRIVDIEKPVSKPNFNFFITEVDRLKKMHDLRTIILQIHPNQWKKIDYLEFSKCLDYLDSQFHVTYIKSSDLLKKTKI